MALAPHNTSQLEALHRDPALHESTYVHAVYDSIADHFSQTRYKPWPIIAAFLASLAPGSIGLDSGCGNGKYLPLDQGGKIMLVGLDRSLGLLAHAQWAGGKERHVVRGDVMNVCWRPGAFDFAISIATIHHLCTLERRRQAVQALLQAVSSSDGRVLIYVWATEQDELSKRIVPVDPEKAGEKVQDVFVPWKKAAVQRANGAGTETETETELHQRYYHLFTKDELGDLVREAAKCLGLHILQGEDSSESNGLRIVQEGWERSNWYIELLLTTAGA
ncbi:S-adenosyl-L-methionine-dependent methyltransferase [Dacryopinax primogenitus]|uniref:S-adenosyl-L-methionine-dependent methyltransferase n=1 Tax=Dacryopinax primogenitus (strain DJM 731) TaxID=1858805 RepID=M5FY94_DACPD|nr:S-adenosyl-L-methionine-dependent methyltransferase [Dacryopinax primogenitus]EJU00790.1 S-adenosyl-L-methionine-dependent methyltransferase [Dacryopinax primogenitus]